MASVKIKNLPDGLYRKLKARAKRERRSVAQEVTALLTEALDSAAPVDSAIARTGQGTVARSQCERACCARESRVAPMITSSGPRASRSLMILSEQDARGPEDM